MQLREGNFELSVVYKTLHVDGPVKPLKTKDELLLYITCFLPK